MKEQFLNGFNKKASKKGAFKSELLYRLSRGLAIKMKGFSGKSLKRTAAGRKL